MLRFTSISGSDFQVITDIIRRTVITIRTDIITDRIMAAITTGPIIIGGIDTIVTIGHTITGISVRF
jgi:hypothetical protein